VAWLIAIPLLGGIIWYETSGFEKYQIFANKLVSSICWSALELFALIHTSLMVR
jgi:hypothetical protein